MSSTALGSGTTYRHYTVEVKGFLPRANARFVTAVRAAYNQTLGDDVPFLERSILGGKNTLRGHGDNRFIDSSYVLLNIEERIRLFRYRVYKDIDLRRALYFYALDALVRYPRLFQTVFRLYRFVVGRRFSISACCDAKGPWRHSPMS